MEKALEGLENLRNFQKQRNILFQPQFYRLGEKKDLEEFKSLLKTPGITVVDFISDQVKELIKFKHPQRKFSTNELEKEIKNHMGSTNPDFYGIWVFYPWANRLVHLLDEEEFIEVRTSRNQYKITPEERQILASKKIGVIGLSVGQSVSVTLAMERICGELRLADFDILELTNLNRIRTGVHNLGLPKVYSVAREIAEIDPFLKVVCYPQGLTEENMDDFFTKGGNLDLLVEESDGFDIKILCRYKARELRIPVIMEGSDRCLVDVERFDLEPKRSILHGLVDHLDIALLKTLKTNEEKIPYMLDILGLESSSLRLKASMLEIEQTINTWPQLASAVTMGGGITADVARRMLLNQYTESGRYHIDIEELIGNKKDAKAAAIKYNGHLADLKYFAGLYEPEKDAGQASLDKELITQLVKAACQAPSGGNSQPWRWIHKNNTLLLFNGFHGFDNFLGFNNYASMVAFGAAIENIKLKAAQSGYETKFEIFPDKNIAELIAAIRFYKDPALKSDNTLAGAIGKRLTNRQLGKRQAIDKDQLEKLVSAAKSVDGIELRFFENENELEKIGELLGELEQVRIMEKQGHSDFVSEIRWTKKENDETRDGIDLRTLDLTSSEKVGLEVAKDPAIIEMLAQWNGGGAFKKLTKKSIAAAGAVGLLTMPEATPGNFLKGGMALEKVWLLANASGISFQPMAASVFTFARLIEGKGEGISPKNQKRLKELRNIFEQTFLLPKNAREIFIFRLSKSSDPEIKSLRKPLDELFWYL